MFKKFKLAVILIFSVFLSSHAIAGIQSFPSTTSNKQEADAETDWTTKLDNAISQQKYKTAALITQNEKSAALIGRLRPWAEKNDTVAQWLYAQALYDEKRYEESAKWTFIAFFFTRYDASLCTNSMALNLEKTIADNYYTIVNKSRSNREILNNSVLETISYLKNVKLDSLASRSPVWICEMVDKLPSRELTVPTTNWKDIYDQRLNQFILFTTGKNYNK